MLPTKNLRGVEVLAPGKWNDDPYTTRDLDDMVTAFYELKGTINPPGKLGHDKGQALAQRDGFPAIGWVSKLYRVGRALVADFEKVPAKVADLISAGAYNQVSSEVYFDLKVGDKLYRRVLRAVAFLGADSPAVRDIKSIADVANLYGAYSATVAHYADLDLEELADSRKAAPGDPGEPDADDAGEYDETDAEYASTLDHHCAQIQASLSGKNGGKAVAAFLSRARAQLAGMKGRPPFATNSEVNMDIKVLAEVYGLPATATEAEVLAAARAAQAKATAPTTVATLSEADARELRDSVGAMARQLAERDASDAVQGALREGKLAPAQLDWAKSYALADLAGFKTYCDKTPKLAVLAVPTGYDGAEPAEADAQSAELTATDIAIARQLGTPLDALKRAKTRRPTAEILEEENRTRQLAARTAGKVA